MKKAFYFVFCGFFLLTSIGVGGVFYIFYKFGHDLPEHRQLAKYEPPVMTRVHAGDGRLLAEYATEKRVFVPILAMPQIIIKAFLSAEDKNFYEHRGIDFIGVSRAVLINLKNIGRNRRKVGASTITQQVAKNKLLTNEVSWTRKIKEAILAIRIETALTKDRILELYLNEIYLGFESYGVAAAALNYFNKSLNQLNLEEVAFLAALPKAPNNYHPTRRPVVAKTRRNWVIERMRVEEFISHEEARIAKGKSLNIFTRDDTEFVSAPYFSEEVRRKLVKLYGSSELYTSGLSVRTTLNPILQEFADKALRKGLQTYDRRHGWRGPFFRLDEESKIDLKLDWEQFFKKNKKPKGLHGWVLALVLEIDTDSAHIVTENGNVGVITIEELLWARKWEEGQKLGPKIVRPSDVLQRGDIVAVELINGNDHNIKTSFGLRQIPDVNGAVVAMDPHTGRVLAMSGGYSQARSEFNRVTQAYRQPGSAFKPFVYLTAIRAGKTPSTLILDAPFVIDQGPGLPKWRPANYTKKFYGPSTMRLGIEKSKNLMTVRLAQEIGMKSIVDNALAFGVSDNMPQTLAASLGASETTLIRITNAYAMLVNGGKKIAPTFIDRIQDRHGKTVFRHDQRVCYNCDANFEVNKIVPYIEDTREQVTDPASAYQIVAMLEGVIERGTGRRIKVVGKPLAGKTGTTNKERDAWFIGFSPDLAVGVFVGFDTPIPLGKRETGSSVAAPIFRDFMRAALAGKPAIPFRIPPGVRMVRVNSKTGRLARSGEKDIILEAFKTGTEPTGEAEILEGESWSPTGAGVVLPKSGTGSLY